VTNTPTTESVRNAYGWSGHDNYAESNRDESKACFDRWLAAHDAEIRTAALEEAAVITEHHWDKFYFPNKRHDASQIAAAIRAEKVDPQ
jgi:hypothetical protein